MILRHNLKLILIVFPYLFLYPASASESASGCLVKTKKKILFDPTCKCLEKNLCATPVKITYKDANFSQRDSKDKILYTDKEKKLHKDSYDAYNKIMELKSKGKGESKEIKEHYQKLASLNSAILETYKRSHPDAYNLIRKTNEKAKKKVAKRLSDQSKLLLSGQLAKLNDTKATEKTDPLQTVKRQQPVQTVVKENVSYNVNKETAEQLSNEDKKYILKNIKPTNYQRNEEDSIFDIISKKYKSRAYKDLLEINE